MSNVRYIPISEDNFDTDEENIDDLLSQVDGLVKSSTINVLRGKNLNHIAVIDESVVGALYTEFNGSEFSFDVIVAKDNQSSGIGKELTSIAMSEYNMYADMGNVKLMLDVVNPRYNEFLINQYGLSIVDKVDGHIILTDKPDESSMTESVHDKFISFVEKFRKYDPILVEAIQHGYNVIFKSYNQLESINILLNDEATKLVNKYRIGGKHKDTELPTRDKLPHDTYVIIDLPLSELSNDEIESLKSNSDPDRVNSYSDIKIDTHIYAFKQRKTGEWYVSDGGHRVTAALKRGDHTIPAIVPLKDVYDMVSLNESANDRFKYTYLNDTFDKYKKVINDYYQKVFESLYENCRQVSDMRINLTDLDQKYRHLESMPIIFTATEGDQASFISIHNKRYIHIPTPSTLYTLATEFKLEYLDEVKKLFPDIDHEIAYKYLSVPGNLTQYKFDDGTDLFNSYISLWKEYKSKVSHIVNTTTRGIFIHEMVHAMDSTDFKFNDTDSKTKYQYYNSPHERNAYLIGLLSEVDMNADFKDIISNDRIKNYLNIMSPNNKKRMIKRIHDIMSTKNSLTESINDSIKYRTASIDSITNNTLVESTITNIQSKELENILSEPTMEDKIISYLSDIGSYIFILPESDKNKELLASKFMKTISKERIDTVLGWLGEFDGMNIDELNVLSIDTKKETRDYYNNKIHEKFSLYNAAEKLISNRNPLLKIDKPSSDIIINEVINSTEDANEDCILYVYIGDDKYNSIGLAVNPKTETIELFDENEESNQDTIDAVIRLLNDPEEYVKVYSSQSNDVIESINNTLKTPKGMFVSLNKNYAEKYLTNNRDLISFEIQNKYLNPHSKYDFQINDIASIKNIIYV